MRQFVESLKRLYSNQLVNRDKVMGLHNDGKLTAEEVNYILN
jgi:hypothetical protein